MLEQAGVSARSAALQFGTRLMHMGEVTSAVEQTLRQRIEDETYKAGDKLPSERTLAAELGAGRTTIRLVLGKLVAVGLIEAQHGRGYFVSAQQAKE